MRKSLFVLALAGFASVATAQNATGYENVSGDKYEVFTNRFKDNWFFSLGGGGEMLLGNKDVVGSINDRISPTLNFAVGKWFTPGLGLRLQYSGLQARGYTDSPLNPYVDANEGPDGYYKQKFDYMNLHGDALFNLNALFGGYNPNRVYEIIPYLGAGFTHTYSGQKKETLSVNGGLINKFRVSPALDLNLELSIMGTEGRFDAEPGGKFALDGVVAATAGITYRFAQRTFKKPQPARQIISEAEFNTIRERMTELSVENMQLREAFVNMPEPVVATDVIVVEPNIAPRSVFFTIGSSKVSPQELVNLGFVADQMKEYPDVRYTLIGYADAKTGTAEKNKELTLKRAQAVIDALVITYNIDRSRLSAEGAGGVEIFDKEYLNRMVLIEVAK